MAFHTFDHSACIANSSNNFQKNISYKRCYFSFHLFQSSFSGLFPAFFQISKNSQRFSKISFISCYRFSVDNTRKFHRKLLECLDIWNGLPYRLFFTNSYWMVLLTFLTSTGSRNLIPLQFKLAERNIDMWHNLYTKTRRRWASQHLRYNNYRNKKSRLSKTIKKYFERCYRRRKNYEKN